MRENGISETLIEYLAYQRLLELKNPYKEKEIIRFPDDFSKLCTIFCLTKVEAFMVLQQIEGKGLIEIIHSTGIRI